MPRVEPGTTAPEEGRPEDQGDPLDEIAQEFLERLRKGERPPMTEYAARVPERATELKDLLSALMMVEDLKPREDFTGDPTGRMWAQAAGPGTKMERLGDYRIIREVGRGGMGVVYEAEQLSLGRRVALKVLSTSLARTPQQVARFLREARSAAQLHHTNIVPVFGVGDQDGLYFYAMQFIHGQGLDRVLLEVAKERGAAATGHSEGGTTTSTRDTTRSLVADRFVIPATGVGRPVGESEEKREGTLTGMADSEWQYARSVARVGVQVAEALEYAHQHGTLHRDIKPSNLLLDSQGTVWVTDFGLAKAAEDDDLTRTGDLVGTLRYMAPERFRGQCDARSDIHALGLTLYELLAFRPAFDASGRERLAFEITHAEPRRLRSICPEVPRDLETIVHKSIEREPSDRYATAASLAEDLRCFLEHRAIGARRVGSTERLTRWARRNPGLATLGTVVAGLLAMIVLVISAADLRLRREHDQALENLHRAELAEGDALAKLLESNLARARAGRRGGGMGRRFESLAALESAARQSGTETTNLRIRNEAIACLALEDLRPAVGWRQHPDDGFVGFDFDPAMRWAARGTRDGTVIVGAADRARDEWALPGQGIPAVLLRFSPNGDFLAVKHEHRGRVELVVWDMASRRSVIRIADGVHSDALDFHPQQPILACGRRDGTIVEYDLRTGAECRRLPPGTVPHLIRYDPSGTRLAVASPNSDESVQLRGPDGEVIGRWRRPEATQTVEWHPEGEWIAAGGRDGRIYLLDPVDQAKAPVVFGQHDGDCVSIAVHPGGRLLASAGWDGTVRLWDARAGHELLRGPLLVARPLRFSRDGRHAGPGHDGTMTWVWDVAEGVERRTIENPGLGAVLAASAGLLEKEGLVVAGSTGGVLVGSSNGGGQVAGISLRETRGVALDPEGDFLITSGASGLLKWPIERGSDGGIVVGPAEAVGALGGVLTGRVRLSRDGRTLAAVIDEERGRVVVLDLKDPARRAEFSGHRGVDRLDVSPDGRWVATGTWKGRGVSVWDARTGTPIRELDVAGSADVEFSPDGKRLVTGTGSEYVLWETAGWTPVNRISRGGEWGLPGHAAFDAEGRVLAMAKTRTLVQLIDVSTGRQLATFESPSPGQISCLCFGRGGSSLVVGTGTRPVEIWDLEAIGRGMSSIGLEWEARAVLSETPAEPEEPIRVEVRPLSWMAEMERAESLIREGVWDGAARGYARSLEQGAPGGTAWVRLSMIRLIQGDQVGYRDACDRMLRGVTADGPSAVMANELAWTCALGPGAREDYSLPIRLAEISAQSRPEPNRLNTLGAILYRAGRLEESLRALEASIASHGAGGTQYDAVFLAMVHQRLGHEDVAEKWMEKAEARASEAMIKPDATGPSSWLPSIELGLLREEARRAVRGDGR